jgi:hypothetical protein
LYVSGEKAAIIMLKILGTNIQNLVAWVTKCLGFMQPCGSQNIITLLYSDLPMKHTHLFSNQFSLNMKNNGNIKYFEIVRNSMQFHM